MPKFDFLGNRVFDDRFSSFAPQLPQTIPGKTPFEPVVLDTGAKVSENGDVTFGIYAPNASGAYIYFAVDPKITLTLEKCADGVWRGVLPFDPEFCGPKAFTFVVDGAEVISPWCPQFYSNNRPINFVEIPDPKAPFVLMRDVPHGSVVTEYYWSDAFRAEQRCLIYLPPDHYKGGEFPVLYLQHGNSENETSWIYNGRINHIMDNLIADGEIEPFIVVMNDGMPRAEGETEMDSGPGLGRSLIENCIPLMERKYRAAPDKWRRAIAGFSMGSVQASIIGLQNPDVFAWIGLLSGFMRKVGPVMDFEKSFEVNSHLKWMEDRERFEKEIALYYRSVGSLDRHMNTFRVDDEVCDEHGFSDYANVVRHVEEGYPHDWAVMRILYRDFAARLFKR